MEIALGWIEEKKKTPPRSLPEDKPQVRRRRKLTPEQIENMARGRREAALRRRQEKAYQKCVEKYNQEIEVKEKSQVKVEASKKNPYVQYLTRRKEELKGQGLSSREMVSKIGAEWRQLKAEGKVKTYKEEKCPEYFSRGSQGSRYPQGSLRPPSSSPYNEIEFDDEKEEIEFDDEEPPRSRKSTPGSRKSTPGSRKSTPGSRKSVRGSLGARSTVKGGSSSESGSGSGSDSQSDSRSDSGSGSDSRSDSGSGSDGSRSSSPESVIDVNDPRYYI